MKKGVLLLVLAFLAAQGAYALCSRKKEFNITLDAVLEDVRIGDAARREKAIQTLGEACNRDSVKPLLYILTDVDADAAATAALALGTMKVDEAVDPLAAALSVDDARSEAAATALGLLKKGEAVPRLTKAMLKCKRVATRANAAWALSVIADNRAEPFLLKAAINDKAVDVRAEALRACGRVKMAKALPTIQAYLGGTEPEMREAAVQALGLMKHLESRQTLESVMLGDSSPEVRATAAAVVGELLFQESLPALAEAKKDKSADVRAEAAAAYDRINDALQHKLKKEKQQRTQVGKQKREEDDDF